MSANPVIDRQSGEVILPYFEGNEELIKDYLEAYEISQNQKKLQAECENSYQSGVSSFEL